MLLSYPPSPSNLTGHWTRAPCPSSCQRRKTPFTFFPPQPAGTQIRPFYVATYSKSHYAHGLGKRCQRFVSISRPIRASARNDRLVRFPLWRHFTPKIYLDVSIVALSEKVRPEDISPPRTLRSIPGQLLQRGDDFADDVDTLTITITITGYLIMYTKCKRGSACDFICSIDNWDIESSWLYRRRLIQKIF